MYKFPRYGYSAKNPVNTPRPKVVANDPDGPRDAHGAAVLRDTKGCVRQHPCRERGQTQEADERDDICWTQLHTRLPLGPRVYLLTMTPLPLYALPLIAHVPALCAATPSTSGSRIGESRATAMPGSGI